MNSRWLLTPLTRIDILHRWYLPQSPPACLPLASWRTFVLILSSDLEPSSSGPARPFQASSLPPHKPGMKKCQQHKIFLFLFFSLLKTSRVYCSKHQDHTGSLKSQHSKKKNTVYCSECKCGHRSYLGLMQLSCCIFSIKTWKFVSAFHNLWTVLFPFNLWARESTFGFLRFFFL